MDLRENILTKARTMFMRYGIRSVTMDDLARDLGISKKTLYQHIDNKEDLIKQIFEYDMHEERQLVEELVKTSPNAIEEIFGLARYVIAQLRELSDTVVYDLQKYYGIIWKKMEALHQELTTQTIKENLKRGIEEGLYRKGLNIEIVAKLYSGNISLIIDEGLFPLKKFNKENLFRVFIKYHLHGIVSEKGLKYLKEKGELS